MNLPLVTPTNLKAICERAQDIFQSEDMILKLTEEVIIVGDIHGHIIELFRILIRFGWPPLKTYVFLGDIVDRGEFSLETITLILVMKILFPKKVFVIRGNHEFIEMFKKDGFSNEIYSTYKDVTIENSFNDCFAMMPLAALIFDKVLCIHGGIGPEIMSLKDIEMIPRPIYEYSGVGASVLKSLLWSDPNKYVPGFQPSSRGTGWYFGGEVLAPFLERNGLDCIVRGHECVEKGVEMCFSRKCITVFTASRYCGLSTNKSGVLIVKSATDWDVVTFLPVPCYQKRADAVLQGIEFFGRSIVAKASQRTCLPMIHDRQNHRRFSDCEMYQPPKKQGRFNSSSMADVGPKVPRRIPSARRVNLK